MSPISPVCPCEPYLTYEPCLLKMYDSSRNSSINFISISTATNPHQPTGPRTNPPQVRFTAKVGSGGGSGSASRSVVATAEPSEWSVELGGAPVAQRLQVPLRLAYAISIHKAQVRTNRWTEP